MKLRIKEIVKQKGISMGELSENWVLQENHFQEP